MTEFERFWYNLMFREPKKRSYSRNPSGSRSVAIIRASLFILVGLSLCITVLGEKRFRTLEITSSREFNVEEGSLSFVNNAKPVSQPTWTGTFIHVSKKLSNPNQAKLNFFYPIANQGFAEMPEVTVTATSPLNFPNSRIVAQRSEGKLLINGTNADGTAGYKLLWSFDTARTPYAPIATSVVNTRTWRVYNLFSNDDSARSFDRDPQSGNLRVITNNDGDYETVLGRFDLGVDGLPMLVETPITVGSLIHYFSREGFIFIDDETQANNQMQKLNIPGGIKPKYTLKLTGDCTGMSCKVLIVEERDPNLWFFSVVRLTSGPSAVSIAIPSMDVTALGPLSMPIQMAAFKLFIVAGPNKFHVFDVLETFIDLSPDYISTEYSSLVPGSFVVGELAAGNYRDPVGLLGIFTKPDGKFTVRMFVFTNEQCTASDEEGFCVGECVEGSRHDGFACTPCPVENCKTCNANESVCEACKDGSYKVGNKCIRCPKTSLDAVLPDENDPKCVKTDAPPYNEGYREKQTAPYRVIEACGDIACKSCPADKDTCTECKDPSKGAINQATSTFDCSLAKSTPVPPVTPPATPPPAPPVTPPKSPELPTPEVPATPSLPSSAGSSNNKADVWPKDKVRKDVLNNILVLIFALVKSQPQYELLAVDQDSKKVHSCTEVGCRLEWVSNTLRISFKSTVRIVRAVLILTRKNSVAIRNTRILQEAPDRIVVEDVFIHAQGWFFSWTTVAQLVLWFFRTFGSLVLFSYYPVTAMIVDQLITYCTLLSLYLGPSVTTPDVVLQIISQVKIIWYFYGNPFHSWDRSTLECAAQPGYAARGVACSFLDNYGQNVIGWFGLSTLMVILHYLAGWVMTFETASPTIRKICQSLQKEYGLKYILAKLDANRLEVMLYVLISYSLADSSSKSVVGLVLATIWMVGYLFLAGIFTVVLHAIYKKFTPATTVATPRLTTAPLETEGEQASLARPQIGSRSKGPHSQSRGDSSVFSRMLHVFESFGTQQLAFCIQNILPVSSRSQLFGPIIKYVHTFAICILLLNHATSNVAQCVIGILLESAYVATRFYTRTDSHWIEFASSQILQALAVMYLLLKAISTNDSIPDSNRQGGLAVVMGLVLLVAVLIALGCMVIMLVNVFATSQEKPPAQKEEGKGAIKSTQIETAIKAVQNLPSDRVPENKETFHPRSAQYLDLEIPDEQHQSRHSGILDTRGPQMGPATGSRKFGNQGAASVRK